VVHKLSYYKVKKPSDLIPNYLDYVRNQIEESYVPGKIMPLAKVPEPKVESLKLEVHTSDQKPQKKAVGNNTLFIQQKFANLDRNKTILDCACGGGAQMGTLRNMGFKHIAGLELGIKWLQTAKKQDVTYGAVKADMHWVPFRDEAFDIVFSAHTIEHAYYPAKLLQEFWRAIKTNGRLFVILPYPDSGHEDDFHVAKYELGTNILDQGQSVIKFFEANGFYLTIAERSAGLVNEPLMWLQFRKRLYKRGKPYKPWEEA